MTCSVIADLSFRICKMGWAHLLPWQLSLEVTSCGHLLTGGRGGEHEKEKAFPKLVWARALSLISPLPFPRGKGRNCLA